MSEITHHEPESKTTDKAMARENTTSCGVDTCGKQKVDYLLWGSLAGVVVLFVMSSFPVWVSQYAWLSTMAHTVHEMLYAIWWGILLGAIFVGVLSKIPREFIMSLLGRGGTVGGLFRSAGAGVLLDLCSHGILLVGAKLYERGASAGQVITFLLSSPWNSFALTLILIGLIGLKWTLAFIVLSMIIALITGWVFDYLVKRSVLPANKHHFDLPDDFQFRKEAKARLSQAQFDIPFFRDVLISGIKDSRMVVRWILFGVLLAAVLRAVLDPTQFQEYFGPTMVGLLITVIFATILEVCSEGSAPISADIVNRAQAPGNGFTFLMAGVATDYTEVMVLKDTTKSWKLALFLPLVSVPQILLVAWLINTYA